MASKTLIDHFVRTRENLISLSNHLEIAKHGDIKGLAREALISQFLSSNLPSMVDFKTGEIFDYLDNKSGQIDIILQAVSSPRISLYNDLQISFSDAVIAAIEVKSNLTTSSWEKESHLKNALLSIKKTKSLHRFHNLEGLHPSHEPYKNTPCVLFAFSGPTPDTLIRKILSFGKTFKVDLESFAPDLTLVLDRGYSVFKNDGWIYSKIGDNPFLCSDNSKECLIPLFVYLCKLVEVWNVKIKHTMFNEYLCEKS